LSNFKFDCVRRRHTNAAERGIVLDDGITNAAERGIVLDDGITNAAERALQKHSELSMNNAG